MTGQSITNKLIFSQEMVGILIDDLLDLAKLENNQFTIKSEYFDLGNLIKESFQMLIHTANENGIKL